MFTGPVGPVELFFTGPKLFWGIFTGLAGAIGSPLASSPDEIKIISQSILESTQVDLHIATSTLCGDNEIQR